MSYSMLFYPGIPRGLLRPNAHPEYSANAILVSRNRVAVRHLFLYTLHTLLKRAANMGT